MKKAKDSGQFRVRDECKTCRCGDRLICHSPPPPARGRAREIEIVRDIKAICSVQSSEK